MKLMSLPFAMALAALAPPASADRPTKQCIAANEEGQDLRRAGRLREAEVRFAACTDPACPIPLRADCRDRRAEVETAMPTIVFEVKMGENAAEPTHATVTIDNAADSSPVGGTPLRIEPGWHHFTIKADGASGEEVRRLLAAGDHRREVITLRPAEPTTAPARRPSPWLYAAFTLAGVGALVGAGFLVTSARLHAELSDVCPEGRCPSERSDDVAKLDGLWRGAAIAFGVAGAAAGVGVYLLLVPRTRTPPGRPTPARIKVSFGATGFSLGGRIP